MRKTTLIFFTAALLHDIGKLALSKVVNNYFGEVTKCMQEEGVALLEAEKRIYGVEHAELGGQLAELWNFPKPIVAAIRHHHSPFAALENGEVVQRIYLCDVISAMVGIGGMADRLPYQVYVEVLKQFNLKEEDSDWFATQLNDQFHFVKKVLNGAWEQEKGNDLFDFFAISTLET